MNRRDESDSDSDSDVDLLFAHMNMKGVDFGDDEGCGDDNDSEKDRGRAASLASPPLSEQDLSILITEFGCYFDRKRQENENQATNDSVVESLALQLGEGNFIDVLRGPTASKWLSLPDLGALAHGATLMEAIHSRLILSVQSISDFVQVEFLAVASFNLFLQLNYTGPIPDDIDAALEGVNPHPSFLSIFRLNSNYSNLEFHNAVLSQLVVDGVWPCQIVQAPYLLLLARCLLSSLRSVHCYQESDNTNQEVWKGSSWQQQQSNLIVETRHTRKRHPYSYLVFKVVDCWGARCAVAHERLLLSQKGEPTESLWNEVQEAYQSCIDAAANGSVKLAQNEMEELRATLLLELGLAKFHFDRSETGRETFLEAIAMTGLTIEVTGAQGKRTRFQKNSKAQYMIKATSRNSGLAQTAKAKPSVEESKKEEDIYGDKAAQDVSVPRRIDHDDGLLLDRIKFENEDHNTISDLSILDQALILALCLDVKSKNPSGDELTAEEMGAYLARVLCHQDDWMVYSTALLERAWVEYAGSHTKERSLLQLQALADQHTNRLTITQSTKQSIDESSPVQDRLRNLHKIIYPPRWYLLRDLGERYAQLGIVTSAAEIFAQIEYWDAVVSCYRRAGKEQKAEEVVRKQLAVAETPRMWVALGDITKDVKCYEKAASLSNGRFSLAYSSLGQYYFDNGDMQKSVENYRRSLKLRPLAPAIWFRVGTICMQLGDWEGALIAFSEVVSQEPDEAEAWANVAAVHMHNRRPAEAYPALNESLKQNRNNWRVWVSKLYTCLDLEKYDEAIQSCVMLIDLAALNSSQDIPAINEKCVRAIVGGTLSKYQSAVQGTRSVSKGADPGTAVAALESAKRSLERAVDLLKRISTMTTDAWVLEAMAVLYSNVGKDDQVLDMLMREYRSLQSTRSWERDDKSVKKICNVVSQIVDVHRRQKENGKNDPAAMSKMKYLVQGVVRRVRSSRLDGDVMPDEVKHLEKLLRDF